jgi:hypothetical protein
MKIKKEQDKKLDPVSNDFGFRKKKDSMSAWISESFK